MYYELYIDVFFFVNFMMDYILLLLLKRILKCSATHGRVCMGATLGALLTCIVISLPIPYAFVKFILFHIVVNTGMIKLGLKIKKIGPLIKAWLMLYAGSFLLGGILTYMQQYVRVTSFFFGMAVFGYYLTFGVIKLFMAVVRIQDKYCEIELYYQEQVYHVKALIDTGNGLRDPISFEPVHILQKKVLPLGEKPEEIKGIRFIPYHSIGKSEGILPVVRLEKMRIQRETELWIEKPIIGICEEEISQGGDYKMILNPEIF